MFQLQVLKPLVVDVAYPLMQQVDIRLVFLSFREQDSANVIGVEDEQLPVSASLRNNLALFLDEALEMCESYLHPLVHDLSDLLQILRYFRDV